jgi:hypothetical protein
MPRGPRTPAGVRIKVVEVFMRLREQAGEDPTAKEVREALRQEFEKSPHALPSLRQVQAILTQARHNSPLRGDEDGPWSMAASQAHGISTDANGILLEMWAFGLTINKKLTIRQAQWIDRLRLTPAALEGHERLYTWATVYAGREKAALLAEQEMDTTDLDAFLACYFDKKSYFAGRITGAYPDVTAFIEDIAEVDPISAYFVLGRVPRIAVPVIQGHYLQHQQHPITAPLHQLQQEMMPLISPEEVASATIKSLWYVWRFWGMEFLRSEKIIAMDETEQEKVLQELVAEIVNWFRSIPPLSPDSPDINNWIPSMELLGKAGFGGLDSPQSQED